MIEEAAVAVVGVCEGRVDAASANYRRRILS